MRETDTALNQTPKFFYRSHITVFQVTSMVIIFQESGGRQVAGGRGPPGLDN